MANIPDGFEADVANGISASALAEKHGVHRRTIFKWKKRLRKEGKLPPIVLESPKLREDGNYAEAASTGPRIKDVESLKAEIKLDEEVWEIYDQGVNKWEVGAKHKEGRLEWEDGKIVEGVLTYNGIVVQDLWSVWLKARRRKLLPVTWTIQPIESPSIPRRSLTEPETSPTASSLVWSDPQFGYRWNGYKLEPFHDREVLDLWLQIAAFFQPTRIDILGDILDLSEWTDRFIRDPDQSRTTQPSIVEAYWWLRRFREEAPYAEIRVHPGNHDARLRNALLRHLPVAYGLKAADELELPPQLSPERLLALHQLDISWMADYPNDEDWLGDSLSLSHGQLWAGTRGRTSKKVAENSDVSTIQGHGHRTEVTSITRRFPNRTVVVTAYNVGCSCRIDEGGPPSKNAINDWQQSGAIVDYTPHLHAFHLLPISTGSPKEVICGGELFTAKDRTEELRRDYPEFPW